MHFCPRFISRGCSSCWVFTAFIVAVMVTDQTLMLVVTKLLHHQTVKWVGVEQHRIRKLFVAVIIKLAVQIIHHLLQVIVKLLLLRKVHLQHRLLTQDPTSLGKPNLTGHHHQIDHHLQLLRVVRINYRHHLV